MRQKICVLAVLLIACGSIHAQDRRLGQSFPEVSVHYGFDGNDYYQNHYSVTALYGYRINNNIRIGLGTGFEFNPFIESSMYEFELKDRLFLPLFAEVKYRVHICGMFPYLKIRGGSDYDLKNHALGYKVNPEVGMDIGRVSIGIGIDYNKLRYNSMGGKLGYTTLACGISYRFR